MADAEPICETVTQIHKKTIKIQIKKSDKFNVVAIVLTNNPEPLEGFTEIIDAKEIFIAKKTRISELLTTLNKPVTEV